MPETLRPRVLVVGGGLGGYVAAIRAGQLGLDTVLVEAGRLGGTCLIRGCIPSKALIHVAGLLARAKIRVVQGWATFSDAKSCTVETAAGPVSITAEHVILAAGSEAVALPGLPFGGNVISSTEALSLSALPERLVVVGAGYIGLELGIAFRKLGAAVSVVEAADKILVAVGRRPLTEGWGLEAMALDREGPFVKVDDRCKTAMRGVWAIGDLVGEPMLAHKALAQGAMVAEIIAGQERHFDPASVAAIVFTDPEIVVAGMLPEEAEAARIDAATSVFPFAASGRAMTLEAGAGGGFVRVVADRWDGRILGLQAVGRHVAELAGEFAHALAMGA